MASLQLVRAVAPHPNSDRLELISILDYQVCEVKGRFHVGQQVVFCENDSLLPTQATWLPMPRRRPGVTPKWYHVKPIKVHGEISEGFIIPLTPAVQYALYSSKTYDGVIGEDVTSELSIRKKR